MIKKFETIKLYKGATSIIEFDFSKFNFKGGKCVFSMTDINRNIIKQYEFTEATKYFITLKTDFTSTLNEGLYKYNIMFILEGERYPQCLDSDIKVERVINAYGTSN